MIDPQQAFTHDLGTLAKAHGVNELTQIKGALLTLEKFISQVQQSVNVYYVRSEYKSGQFSEIHSSPLFSLCTGQNRVDLEWSLPPRLISQGKIFTKYKKSAFSSPELQLEIREKISNGLENIFLAGFLFTSFVLETALEFSKQVPEGIKFFIVEDACGSRISKHEANDGESDYNASRKALQAAGIFVCNSSELNFV